jgi:hypothetical protein
MKKFTKILVLLAFLGLSFSSAYAETYELHRFAGIFRVICNGELTNTFTTLQAAIDFIKTHADGTDCTIKFGSGTEVLNLGSGDATLITFDGNGTPSWGKITLTGKATTTSTADGVIRLENDVSIDCQTELSGTGSLIYNASTGTITISDGVISATSNGGKAVVNASTGMINISGGEVLATGNGGRAVRNESTGAVNISGGKVSSSTWVAVVNYSTGKITVSNTALITSANENNAFGTIYLFNTGSASGCRLDITGGTVENTATGVAIFNASPGTITISGGKVENTATGVAIYNDSPGTMTISGGTVKTTTGGRAIENYGTLNISGGTVSATDDVTVFNAFGTLTISGGMILATTRQAIFSEESTATLNGGIVFAYGTTEADVIYGDYTQTDNAIIIAWNESTGTTEYEYGTNDDIFKFPAAATAIWTKQGSNNGIQVSYDTNTGFIPIEGVTVTGVGIVETHCNASVQVYPNPTKGQLVVSSEYRVESIEIFDVMGRKHEGTKARMHESDPLGVASTLRLDILHLPAGIYFLRIQTENGMVTKKVIKQ